MAGSLNGAPECRAGREMRTLGRRVEGCRGDESLGFEVVARAGDACVAVGGENSLVTVCWVLP
jgi:hypothetical protein